MKLDVINDLIAKIRPYVDDRYLDDIRMQIDLALHPYDIVEAHRELVPYQRNETEEAIMHFLAAKIAKGLAERTIDEYGYTLRFIFRKLQIPYNKVTSEDLRLYLARRINVDGVSKVSVDNERRVLSSFYGWLRDNDIVLKSPMSKVERIKRPSKKKTAFTQMEIEKLRTACSTARETALIETLLSTWARASELGKIRIDEIEDDQVIIHGKGDKERIVYLNPKAQLAISRYISERRDKNPYLFPKSKYPGDVGNFAQGVKRSEQGLWYRDPKLVHETEGMGGDVLNLIVKKIGRHAGVENVHMHRFRRTGATLALMAGMPVITVSKLLGHASIETTQIYLDVSDDDLKAAHAKFVI